jgi:hypothetical protein
MDFSLPTPPPRVKGIASARLSFHADAQCGCRAEFDLDQSFCRVHIFCVSFFLKERFCSLRLDRGEQTRSWRNASDCDGAGGQRSTKQLSDTTKLIRRRARSAFLQVPTCGARLRGATRSDWSGRHEHDRKSQPTRAGDCGLWTTSVCGCFADTTGEQ